MYVHQFGLHQPLLLANSEITFFSSCPFTILEPNEMPK